MVKFLYPTVMIVKGCNEILMYSITEDLYYYIKLNSPILFESSTICSVYGLELKWFLDLGDYLANAMFSLTTGANSYISVSITTKYFEKSEFPDGELLAGFEQMKVKFNSKEEDAFILQFSDWLMWFGSLTNGLLETYNLKYKKGELMQISYDGFFTWKKGEKNIVYIGQPLNFNDQ